MYRNNISFEIVCAATYILVISIIKEFLYFVNIIFIAKTYFRFRILEMNSVIEKKHITWWVHENQ